jgi:hypothetical protein
VHPGGIRRYSRTRAVPAYPKTCVPAPPSSNMGRWLWLTVRQRQAPTLGKMAAIRVPAHLTDEYVLGACGASGLCSRSGCGTHGRAPAAGSAVCAPGCTRDRRRSRRNQGVAPQNSLTQKLTEQFSWVRALAKHPPTPRRRTWRLDARSGEIGVAPSTALPARGLHGGLHGVACQPPFRSGPPLPPTEEACTGTPAAALKAKLCGLSLQTHRPVERGPRDRARTENVLWHGSHHAMGTAARPGLSLPVHVLAGRVTTLQSCEFCAGRWADAPRVRDRRSLGLLLCPALNMRGVHG